MTTLRVVHDDVQMNEMRTGNHNMTVDISKAKQS